MIFGFLIFTSCPKPTWAERYVQTPQQTLWTSLFSSDTTHSDTLPNIELLQIDPSSNVYNDTSGSSSAEQMTKTLSWRPSHQQLWNLQSTTDFKQTQYANWTPSSVTVLAHTPCDTENLTWQSPALNATGTKEVLSQNTILDISIPPYLQEVTVHIQCGTKNWAHTWKKKNSLPIPTVQWTKSEHSVRVLASNANGHTLRLWNLNDQHESPSKWMLLNSKFISHTLDGWEIEFPFASALNDVPFQFQLSNSRNQIILESEPFTIPSQQPWIPNNTDLNDSSVSHNTMHRSSDSIKLISTVLASSSELDTPSNNPLEANSSIHSLDPILPSHYSMDVQKHLDTVHNLWIADGRTVWDWYNQPIWNSFHPNQESVSHSNNQSNQPPFLRWGDALKISTRSFNGWHTEEEYTWVVGNPYDTTKPLIMSPEDGVFYDSSIQSVMGSALDISIERPSTHSTPWLIRTDSQISDERILDFLPMLMEPSSPFLSASILHHTALYWDAIQDRNLTWFDTVQERALNSLRLLETITNEKWVLLDFHTQLYIVWASLIADQEGLSPQSTFMRRNIDWLCTLSDTDIKEDAALISHLRWLLKDSHWKHRACLEGESLPLIEHQATSDFILTLRDNLKQALDERTTLRINTNAHEWQQWILLEEEQHLRNRYSNIHIQLKTPKSTLRGLFHEWQIRPIIHTLSESKPVNMHVTGVGRLYFSTWQPYIHSIKASEDAGLRVTRTLNDANGIPIPSNTIHLGQPLQIHTTVQTSPNTTFCIRQWGASGLSHQATDHHFCTQSNDQGMWSNTEYVHVQFEGRFRLPLTMVATESAVANTDTLWLQTGSEQGL